MKSVQIFFRVIALVLLLTPDMDAQPLPSIYQPWEAGFTKSLENTHDMALPSWGPYSNKYNGISHVPVQNNGMRFDVIVQPSLYLRNQIALANTQRESGYHPWQASPDLSYFSYRYELEWKDQVYCDVSFSKVDDDCRLIKAAFVNNTGNNRSLALNIFSAAVFPYSKSLKLSLPKQVYWVKAADYKTKSDSIPAFNYNLVYDGQLRGQIRDDNAVSRTAIVFGKKPGEQLVYRFSNNRNLRDAVLMVRYRTAGVANTAISIAINGAAPAVVELRNSGNYVLHGIPIGHVSGQLMSVNIQSTGNNAVILDGFTVVEQSERAAVQVSEEKPNDVPRRIDPGLANAMVLKYDDIEEFYGLVWSDVAAHRRIILDDSPDEALFRFENLVKPGNGSTATTTITGNKKGWFNNVFSAPVIVRPGQQVTTYAFAVSGKTELEVVKKLKLLNNRWGEAEAICRTQQDAMEEKQVNKAGQPYLLSRQLMAATTLTNVMYPTFMGNRYLKHTTPGKKWSSFYTWDAGFIGLGYSGLNAGRALESLNAYTMADTEQSAFLEHGTPLPVQAYLFNELWNKTLNKEYLEYFYPRLKRFYQFLNGAENSPTRKLQSNLIQTWDIFYNSGGWDDYCPQVFVHKQKLEKFTAPTINTSHQIRFAKLLKMAAWQLGYKQDMDKYDADIGMYSLALQKYAWDSASGYYGYVTHDKEGRPDGILKHALGGNFNRGLDGCSPLLAGVCNPAQQQRIIGHLFSEKELWTSQGITAIDQSAPYYDKDGYWNGRVWMPHQWFVWKTMLDLNEPEKAVKIATTALDVWKRETEDTYNCWENFSVETGNGGGWHQFGALSSPVLNWFSALYKPGTVTHGFNTWPMEQQFSADNGTFKGRFKIFSDSNAKTAALLFCMNDAFTYNATCNGKAIPMQKLLNGLYAIKITMTNSKPDTYDIALSRQ